VGFINGKIYFSEAIQTFSNSSASFALDINLCYMVPLKENELLNINYEGSFFAGLKSI
jgi:hypothetical protein